MRFSVFSSNHWLLVLLITSTMLIAACGGGKKAQTTTDKNKNKAKETVKKADKKDKTVAVKPAKTDSTATDTTNLDTSEQDAFLIDEKDKWGTDSIETVKNYSLYREFFKQGAYDDALPYWRYVYKNAPSARKTPLMNGEQMYKKELDNQITAAVCNDGTEKPIEDKIKQSLCKKKANKGFKEWKFKDKAKADGIFDTLLKVYKTRETYFGEKGYITTKKARLYDKYRPSDADKVSELRALAVEQEDEDASYDILYDYFKDQLVQLQAGKVSAQEIITLYDEKILPVVDYNIENNENEKKVKLYQKYGDKMLDKVGLLRRAKAEEDSIAAAYQSTVASSEAEGKAYKEEMAKLKEAETQAQEAQAKAQKEYDAEVAKAKEAENAYKASIVEYETAQKQREETLAQIEDYKKKTAEREAKIKAKEDAKKAYEKALAASENDKSAYAAAQAAQKKYEAALKNQKDYDAAEAANAGKYKEQVAKWQADVAAADAAAKKASADAAAQQAAAADSRAAAAAGRAEAERMQAQQMAEYEAAKAEIAARNAARAANPTSSGGSTGGAAPAPKRFTATDCSSAKEIYGTKFKSNPGDIDNTKRLYASLQRFGCKSDPLYNKALMKIVDAAPTASTTRLVAGNFMKAKQYGKAVSYYEKSIGLESDRSKNAKVHYRLAKIAQVQKKYSKARSHAQKAAKMRPGWGAPYILIGNLYASSAGGMKSDGFNGSSVFWVACDMYNRAKDIDPSVASDANKKISQYSKAFPNKEQVFFKGIKAGASYTVGGWIGQSTKVRF